MINIVVSYGTLKEGRQGYQPKTLKMKIGVEMKDCAMAFCRIPCGLL
ncbi:hypothetical protein [Maribacter polysiphoniae]|nr:hypothetical protein [Maribacter polysiphoniae]